MNWTDIYNSATTFGILAAIAIGVWALVIRKDLESRVQKKK